MVQLIGRITKDATITDVKEGKKVLNFSIALNDSYKPKDGEVVKVVTYVNCAYWINPDKIATYFTKGKLVEVNGRLSVNAYTNMQGDAVGSINFHVNNFKLHGKGSDTDKKNATTKTAGEITEPMDDLPF